MSRFINENIDNLESSLLAKFFEFANKIPDSISLSVGEPDFETPYNISKAGIDAIKKGNTFYAPTRGLNELIEAIIKYNKEKYDLHYEFNEVLTTVGASEAIDLVCRVCLNEGDEVIIPSPQYVSYKPCVVLNKGIAIDYNLSFEDNFRFDINKLQKLITNKTKMIILNYPNNPTGTILSKDELIAISNICIKHDLLVISDEIYRDLIYDKTYISIANLPNMKERTIVINGFSKSFSMTGWRLGYLVGPKDIVDKLLIVHQYSVMGSSIISQYAGIEALNNSENEVIKMRDTYKMRRNYVVNRLRNLGINTNMPDGAFYCFCDIRKFNLTSEEFALKLLEKEKVVVVPGNSFGKSGEGFIRISYAYSIEDLRLALDKIENFIKSL